MEIDFNEVMSHRTDIELVRIVTSDRHKYQEMALLAAENELKKRKIDPTSLEQEGNNQSPTNATYMPASITPKKGSKFSFFLGLFLVLLYSTTLLTGLDFSWKAIFLFFYGLYLFWQNGYVHDTSSWKYKPTKMAIITASIFTVLILLYWGIFVLPFNKNENNFSDEEFRQQLENAFSKRLPIYSENGRVDSIYFVGQHDLKYIITRNINAAEIDRKKFDSLAKSAAIKNLKGNKQLDVLLNKGYNFYFYYKDTAGTPISSIYISNAALK